MAILPVVATSDHLGIGSVGTRGDAGAREGGWAVRHLGLGLISSAVLEEEEGGQGFTFWPPMLVPLWPQPGTFLLFLHSLICLPRAVVLEPRPRRGTFTHPRHSVRPVPPVLCWVPALVAPRGVRTGARDFGAHHSPGPPCGGQ